MTEHQHSSVRLGALTPPVEDEDIKSLLEKVQVRLLGHLIAALNGPELSDVDQLRLVATLCQCYNFVAPQRMIQTVGEISYSETPGQLDG